MQFKLFFYDCCISILLSKKCQTPIILADLLGNESFLQRVQKVIVWDLWLVDFDPFCEFVFFKVRCLWSYCEQNPTLIFQISSLDFRLPNFDEAKILKFQINFWDRKSAIKCRATGAYCTFASKHPLPLLYLGHAQIIILSSSKKLKNKSKKSKWSRDISN